MEKGIFEMDIEFKSPQEIKAYQEARLRSQIAYLAEHSPYYREMFHRLHIDPASIMTLEDLARLPITEKSDLQTRNNDFLCVERADIVDFITTSGTLGEPVLFGLNENDLERLAYNEAKSFACAGLGRGSVLQLMTTMDKRFMAGLAYWLGIRKLGAGIVRVGNGIPELQWDTIRRINPDAIMCVPSFVPKLIDFADSHGIDYHHSSVKKIIGVGEGLRNQDFSLNLLGETIHRRWPEVELYATYSSTEMSATFSECSYGVGGHIHPELLITEIVDERGYVVPDGEPGEVVITTLGVETMPLLRFSTGDVATKVTAPCRCGRNSFRLTPLLGRKNNMLKLKGTTLYPPAIFDVLDNADYVEAYVVTALDTDTDTDDVLVQICLKNNFDDDVIKNLKDSFRARLRVAPRIEVRPREEIMSILMPAKSRKPIKFIDRRKR